jgi:hypothetical protein
MIKRGVQAVILDEAQHLMKIGTGSSAGKLLDQLDWIKSMTNVTGVLHILIGTYELLNFRNLSGQASRRGLDIHFPRYLYQNEQDRLDFQAALLALLKQVPLDIDIPSLMQDWVYFYEHSIGCVGVLKDWLIRTVAAALHDGSETLTLKQLHEHTLTLAQCERMALDATEGEQKLSYMESRREHLWHLLQMGMSSTSAPKSPVSKESPKEQQLGDLPNSTPPSKRKRQPKKPKKPTPPDNAKSAGGSIPPGELCATTTPSETPTPIEPLPKKKQTRKKTTSTADKEITMSAPTSSNIDQNNRSDTIPSSTPALPKAEKKSGTRVGQRKPKRDIVGNESQPQNS